MLQALVLSAEGISRGAEVVNSMFAKGFLINFAGNAALRFAPPLIVAEEEIDRMIEALTGVFDELEA